MVIKLIIGVYILGCIGVVLDIANEIHKRDDKLGFWFCVFFVLTNSESYKHILKSWYYLHK